MPKTIHKLCNVIKKAHVYRMQDKEIAMHMYSLSDKLSKRDMDWS